MKNKRVYFILMFVAGSICGGQAIQYFFSGAASEGSVLKNVLIAVQLLFGTVVAFFGWKNFREAGESNS